jgi:hypothetical protein
MTDAKTCVWADNVANVTVELYGNRKGQDRIGEIGETVLTVIVLTVIVLTVIVLTVIVLTVVNVVTIGGTVMNVEANYVPFACIHPVMDVAVKIVPWHRNDNQALTKVTDMIVMSGIPIILIKLRT